VSFSDKPSIPPLKVAGCMAYCVVATLVVMFFMTADALGDCATGPYDECKSSFGSYLMFPGSLIIAIAIGILLARWATRDQDD
jgi:hypothetical protein